MPTTEETRYYQTYLVEHHPEGLTAKEVGEIEGDVGACHDLLITSIMYEDNGGSSTVFISNTREGEAMTPDELFKVWSLFTKHVSEALPVGGRKALTMAAFEAVREVVLGGRSETPREG